MDIVLRRCSPLSKQPEHRGRTHIVAVAETSSRPAEAALELDSSPHDVMRDGEDGHQRNEPRAQNLFASGNAGLVLSKLVLRPLLGNSNAGPMVGTRLGPTIQLEQPPVSRHPGDQDDMLEGDAGPGESLLASQPALEWLLRHPDPSNVVRLQQVLLQQQRRQQLARSGLGGGQAVQLGGNDLLAEAQTIAGESFVQDEGVTSGTGDREPEPVGKPKPDSPQPSTVDQLPLQNTRKDRAARNQSQADVHTADGGESLSQPQSRQLGPGGLTAGGGGRARTAGKEKAAELRFTGEGSGGDFGRRGRKSTEEELFQAADALELLMNSEPGAGGAMGAAGTTRAAHASASGLNGGIGRVAHSSRAGGSGGPPEAAAPRDEPVVPGRGAAGRGRMGSGGRRGSGGRGTRIGGTGPRIIRGSMPDQDLGDDEEDNPGGAWAGRIGPRDGPLYDGGGGGGRARPGAGPYDAEGDEGADYEEGRPVPGGRNGTYVLDGQVGIAGSGGSDVDFREEDETMFGPVPRRPRTSVYCSPVLYDDIITGANPPSSEVQVLALSWSEFVRLVHRQRQGRGLAGGNSVAVAEQQHLMPRAHLQSERHRSADQLPHPFTQLNPATLLGAMGAYHPQAYSQELLRRALLIQQVSDQGVPTAADWDVPRGDGRYGGAGETAPAPSGRRPSGHEPTTIPWGPRAPAGTARAAGGWQGVVELRPPLGDVSMEEDIEHELRRRQNAQPPYQELYDETAAAMAAAAEQQQQLLEHLALLGIGGIVDGFPGGLTQALGSGEPSFEYGGAGPALAFPQRPEQQYPGRLPTDTPVADLPEEVSAGRKRSMRPGKARAASDRQAPTSDLIPLEEVGVGGGARGSKRVWSKRSDGSDAGHYAGDQGGQHLMAGYENGGAELDSDGNLAVAGPPPYEAALRTRRAPPLNSSTDVLMLQGRTAAGRSSGGGAPPALAGEGSSRQYAGGSRSRIGSMDNAPDDDVEEVLPSPERAASGAVWYKSNRGGGGVGQQSWHGGALGDAGDVDGGPYRPYAGPAGGSDQYSYEQRECSGAVGVVPAGAGAPTPAPISKRQRYAEGGLLNGRSGAAGARGRGRNMSPGPPAAPRTLAPAAAPRASATAAAAAAEQRRVLELTYKPYMELQDVQETRDGQQLSLVFGHTTLGTFAGKLKLVATE
ncbi:hypothetical protein VaNZ11_006997 [Volvox africanus]|uniref:Uncharacterized protein n=1 Tax=Volvox africanus TaxID=51714 RepID=A0ABQ5S2S9_9CHLO|nr:hypothetical protein VaNZ11_006997 [Volvox africanus]